VVLSATDLEPFGRRHMKHLRMTVVVTAAMCVSLAMAVFTAGPTFRADYRFSGTALTDFKPVGSADWKVQNGEIVGIAKDASGGWLLLGGKEFQDTQMYASVKCVGGCKAGFVMRAEKTPDGGMKGVLMSVTENDLVPYIVTIDATGKEVSREPLPAPAGRGGGRGYRRNRCPRGGGERRADWRRAGRWRRRTHSPRQPHRAHGCRHSCPGRTCSESRPAAADVPRARGAVSEGVTTGRPSGGRVHAGRLQRGGGPVDRQQCAAEVQWRGARGQQRSHDPRR
jgi:hypothetical protein